MALSYIWSIFFQVHAIIFTPIVIPMRCWTRSSYEEHAELHLLIRVNALRQTQVECVKVYCGKQLQQERARKIAIVLPRVKGQPDPHGLFNAVMGDTHSPNQWVLGNVAAFQLDGCFLMREICLKVRYWLSKTLSVALLLVWGWLLILLGCVGEVCVCRRLHHRRVKGSRFRGKQMHGSESQSLGVCEHHALLAESQADPAEAASWPRGHVRRRCERGQCRVARWEKTLIMLRGFWGRGDQQLVEWWTSAEAQAHGKVNWCHGGLRVTPKSMENPAKVKTWEFYACSSLIPL